MPNFYYDISGALPVGTIIPWTSDSIPSGWLECNGQEVSRTEYSKLFSIIGTTFGSGDGSTTFNLPDLRGRVIAGFDSGDTDFDSIGKKGGEKTHVLTVDELPAHNHSISSDGNHNHSINTDGEHSHDIRGEYGSAGDYKVVSITTNHDYSAIADVILSAGAHNHGGATGTAGSHNHGGATGNTGGGVGHNNLSPYITLKYIIKAK